MLAWDEVSQPEHTVMLEFYRQLIALRRSEPDLASGDLTDSQVQVDDGARWFSMTRGAFVIVANLAEKSQVVPVQCDGAQVVVSWGAPPVVQTGGIRLDGHDVAVLRTD